jgi:hypothetical protein
VQACSTETDPLPRPEVPPVSSQEGGAVEAGPPLSETHVSSAL